MALTRWGAKNSGHSACGLPGFPLQTWWGQDGVPVAPSLPEQREVSSRQSHIMVSSGWERGGKGQTASGDCNMTLGCLSGPASDTPWNLEGNGAS